YTFGKALGSHGAIVLGARTLKDYLVNFARPLIYSTALPFHNLASILCAYELLIGRPNLQQELADRIAWFGQLLKDSNPTSDYWQTPDSPIQTVMIPGNQAVRDAATRLQTAGLDVRPILSPTVPPGKERLRICLHLFNTDEELKKLAYLLKNPLSSKL
ncbi:MAG TPA: aminotransferase class I/II-fold pyridoxal phosphate-dependent enzyme, partial [Anseongella sp.]